ncbi:MAG: ABC transporter ATP-binding protein [Candidatus Bathyarchaeia archaeon]|jgi:ABC-2 type transport system ATP-binding protein
MTEDTVISIKDLTKKFGHFTAVDEINLTVEEGELYGLLGPNGAGKTTIVRLLCTLIQPTSGTASVAGYDIREQAAQVRRRIGVVSDGVMLYKDLTIEENLKLLSTLYEIPNEQANDRIRELLDMFAFKEKEKRMVKALSTGWTKKAMICAALLHRPSVLFLDEVTTGLDPQSAIALQEFTKSLCKKGVTVIWTTHYMGEPDKICDRIGIMFAGKLVKNGTPKELKLAVNDLTVVEVDAPNLSHEQLQKVKQKLNLNGSSKLKYEDSKLLITSDRNNDLAEQVSTALVGVGAKIRAINTKIPSLEDAFIALTGGEEEIDRFVEAGQK